MYSRLLLLKLPVRVTEFELQLFAFWLLEFIRPTRSSTNGRIKLIQTVFLLFLMALQRNFYEIAHFIKRDS
jgi:hypothetical protein